MTTESLTLTVTKRFWFPFKRRLQAEFAHEVWIRPMYLLKALRVNSSLVHLLATVPPNGRIIAAAHSRLPRMREMLAPHFNISLTTYPDQWQISEALKRYGIDMRPRPWTQK